MVAANAAQLGGHPARIAVGGESVGGNLAAATCLQLKGSGEQLPVAQVLVWWTAGNAVFPHWAEVEVIPPVTGPLDGCDGDA